MKRRIIIAEEGGIYSILRPGQYHVHGKTLDAAITAARNRAYVPVDVEIHSQFDAAEVLDSLLGPK